MRPSLACTRGRDPRVCWQSYWTEYNAASGKSLSNLGEKCLHMVTEEGKHTRGTWQIADISRPLSSVRQICKKKVTGSSLACMEK